ncbi:hypothetical protein [Paenibacillus durus]|uniref:hypothetical protein n=1 Tax=Paenibacillus durus TaxID=44251 RepID=UPI0004B8E47F|nr:hypothetical protein [Paenibacillus durus]
MTEEQQEFNEQREMNRTALDKEEQAAGDRGLDMKSDGELEQKKKLVDAMDQPDSFEY